jgi:trigger factor
MRKLKKGCAIVLALALSMSLMTGCGDKGKNDDKKDTTTQSEATATDAADENSETIGQLVDYYSQNVELGNYKGIEYTKADVDVTDDDVQKKVDEFVDGLATYDKDTTSKAKSGDTVNIDFVGTVDGEEFDGGNTNGSGYDLVLGSGSFIDGFEDQIVGHKAGDTFVVKVTFPEDYGRDNLNGKDAEFKTTLNYIKIDKPATYNDELVAANTDYKTTKEYEESVKESLKADKKAAALASEQRDIMVNVMAKCKINDLPAEEIQANTDQLITSIKSQAESYGMDYATYIKLYYGYDDEDEFAQQVYEICQESLREKMVMCAIAKAENVTVTDQETEDYLNDYAKNNNVDVDSIKNSITDLDIKYNALAYKVMNDVLYKNAKAVDSTTTAATTEDTTAAE